MRVVAGTAKGTSLDSVPGESTRPILDRVKTALFDVLRPELPEMEVLDLFAGSGSVGIEALSQGAKQCIFLDIEARAIQTIKNNLERTHLQGAAEVRHYDAFGYLRSCVRSFDLIYVAPPQYQALWVQALHTIAERPELVKPGGQIIAQIDPKEYEQLNLTSFTEEKQKKYGNTLLVFYRKES